MKLKWVEMVLIFLAFTFVSMNLQANEKEGKKQSSGHDEWGVPKEAVERSNPLPSTPESVRQGKDLFQKHCVLCHGQSGLGDGPAAASLKPKPSNLVEAGAHHSEGELAWKIETGRAPMPGWKGTLTENQIWDVVNHIQSLAEASKK
jgi:mono/diheme cytochrome c family protein